MLFLVFQNCAGLRDKEQAELRKLYKMGQYNEASEFLDKSSLKEDEDSPLLYFMERGNIAFANKDYKLAVEFFQKAKRKMEELYTISISKKAKTILLNDTLDNFYGEDFERSYVYYYLALSYFNLYKETGERNNLFSARAEMVAWNAFFENVQKTKEFKTLYFSDIFSKVFAGTIHECIGERSEDAIAINLYQDAREMFDYLVPLYQNFNNKSDEYADNFFEVIQDNPNDFKGKLKKKAKSLVDSEADNLKYFVDFKLLSLLKRYRSNEYKKALKSKTYHSLAIKNVKKAKEKNNISVIIETGLIPKKEKKKIDLNLNSAFSSKHTTSEKILAFAANVAIRTFAYDVLGLKPSGVFVSNNGVQVFDSYKVNDMVNVHTTGPVLQFELPYVENKVVAHNFSIQVYKKDKLLRSEPVALSSPLGEYARLTNKEQRGEYLLKVGTRFLIKQALAVIGAYTTYLSLRGSDGKNETMARSMALIAYMGSSAAASFSEVADVRHWTTLPNELRMASFHLPKGQYSLKLADGDAKNARVINLGKIEITGEEPTIFTYRKSNI
ncbi:MAG: hypothetical protein H6620_07730 [Halobacteriovoraceae bacterium]|nr:hypothetical protein [Halobacteriovoraceae bacterium]